MQVEDTLLQPDQSGHAWTTLVNTSRFTQQMKGGTPIGVAMEATPIALGGTTLIEDVVPFSRELLVEETSGGTVGIQRVSGTQLDGDTHQQELMELIEVPDLPPEEKTCLLDLIAELHGAFSLSMEDRGETDLVQFEIDTGSASPRRQSPRRMPFLVRQEVTRQLQDMQAAGIIQPSKSPWASPIVLVQKKDGSHRFCVDYRELNSVTKKDTFPLPRIDDLLDQLGCAKYFSTLDLASGFWQIRVHPDSVEKTAFAVPQGLYEFVMPFGLCNAPSVFQRLMQQVLMGLNPLDGPDFVSVYIDDVLVFSETLNDNLEHLRKVITRIQSVGLKLKPAKCRFACREVKYLRHLITPSGLKPSEELVASVREFPRPRNLKELHRFLGLTLYYRKFVQGFAKLAQPLHHLTKKDVEFRWSSEYQVSFECLKQKLCSAPVIAFPNFERDFVLETDASIQGIAAVLVQQQEDGKLHPVAYASRALNPAEKNYAITELETLVVVWAVTHFHSYLYGHKVTIYTDHSAVKAVLETPNPTGKHARWWTRIYGLGLKKLNISLSPGEGEF